MDLINVGLAVLVKDISYVHVPQVDSNPQPFSIQWRNPRRGVFSDGELATNQHFWLICFQVHTVTTFASTS